MKRLLFSLSVLLSVTNPLQAQETTVRELDTIDVYGNKEVSRLFQAQHVDIITREEIQAAPVNSVSELLEYASGVDVRQRGIFDVQADIGIRGGTFDQTLIMINGIPVSDPQTGHHNANWPFSLQNVERIEVLYGGGSHRYGPYAFSGAINIITQKKAANELSLSAEYGEHGYNTQNAGVSLKGSKVNGSLGVNRSSATGYLNNTDFNQTGLNGQLTWSLAKHQFEVLGAWSSRGFGAQNFYSSLYPDQYEATRTLLLAANWKYMAGDIGFRANVYARRNWDRFELYRETGEGWYEWQNGRLVRGTDSAGSWYTHHNYHRSDAQGGELTALYAGVLGRSLVGVDARREFIASNNLGLPMTETIAVSSADEVYTLSDERINTGFFVDHRWQRGKWHLGGAIRYNYNTAFGDQFLPGADIRYDINADLSVMAAANRSFRLPTFTDLYYKLGGAEGSRDLQPEFSNNYEIGLEWKGKLVNARIGGFIRDGKNMIDWVVLPDDTTNTLRAHNITELRIGGIDGEVTVNLKAQTNGWVQYIKLRATWLQSPTDSFPFESLYALDYLSHKVGLQVSHKIFRDFGLSWHVNYQKRVGNYIDFSTQEATPFDEVLLVDARAFWKKGDWTVYLEGNNLLDRIYNDRGNVLQPGRWLRIGAEWNLPL